MDQEILITQEKGGIHQESILEYHRGCIQDQNPKIDLKSERSLPNELLLIMSRLDFTQVQTLERTAGTEDHRIEILSTGQMEDRTQETDLTIKPTQEQDQSQEMTAQETPSSTGCTERESQLRRK